MKRTGFLLLLLLILCSCREPQERTVAAGHYARYFTLSDSLLVTYSPYDGHADTLRLGRPMNRLVCMSSSYIGYLDALGGDSVAVGVSGIAFITSPLLQERYARGAVYDVGYDAAPDYERIVDLQPDLLITYAVSPTPSPFLARLQELGVPTLLVYEHLEHHPLARAEYLRLFGALTGRQARADSLFGRICRSYDSLCVHTERPAQVLLNVPYADQWYIPGGDNYMTRLIRDAGGEVLGARPGETRSRVITREEALLLARQADVWLNPGWCDSRAALQATLPAFPQVPAVYNNTRRTTPGGGNDFWESGPVRPDLILQDLRRILSGDAQADSLYYYIPLR